MAADRLLEMENALAYPELRDITLARRTPFLAATREKAETLRAKLNCRNTDESTISVFRAELEDKDAELVRLRELFETIHGAVSGGLSTFRLFSLFFLIL